MQELTYQARAIPTQRVRAIGGLGFDWAVALTGAWLIGGAYLDGWAHTHISDLETFFTPWHAVLYSGFSALASVLVGAVLVNRLRGYNWQQAIPAGYAPALLAVGLFAVAGVGDMLWHVMLGVEADIEALLSPTHILLFFSSGLLVSGPLRAAWGRAQAPRATDWGRWGPAVLSLMLLLSVITISSDFLNPWTRTWAATDRAAARLTRLWELEQAVGVGGVLLQTAVLMGLFLLLIRRWGPALPTGLATLVLTVNVALTMFIHDMDIAPGPWPMIAVALIAGLAIDGLRWWLKPAVARPWAFRAFAAAAPTIFYALYFLAVLAFAGIWWTPHVWLGAIVLAGVTGLLTSCLVLPPQSPAEAPPAI